MLRTELVRMAQVFIVRHGERIDFVDKSWKHRPENNGDDAPLTDAGVAQAKATGEHLKERLQKEGTGEVFVYASPFRRTYRTAAEIARALGVEGVSLEYGLAERLSKSWFRKGPPRVEWSALPPPVLPPGFIDGDRIPVPFEPDWAKYADIYPPNTHASSSSPFPLWPESQGEGKARYLECVATLLERHWGVDLRTPRPAGPAPVAEPVAPPPITLILVTHADIVLHLSNALSSGAGGKPPVSFKDVGYCATSGFLIPRPPSLKGTDPTAAAPNNGDPSSPTEPATSEGAPEAKPSSNLRQKRKDERRNQLFKARRSPAEAQWGKGKERLNWASKPKPKPGVPVFNVTTNGGGVTVPPADGKATERKGYSSVKEAPLPQLDYFLSLPIKTKCLTYLAWAPAASSEPFDPRPPPASRI